LLAAVLTGGAIVGASVMPAFNIHYMLLFGMMIVPVADVFSAFFVMGSFPDVTRAASNLRGLPLSDVGQPRLASPDYRTPLPYCPRYEPPPEAVPTDSMNGPPRLPRGTGSGAGAAGLRQFRLPGRGAWLPGSRRRRM
jgi:hypothetical protein